MAAPYRGCHRGNHHLLVVSLDTRRVWVLGRRFHHWRFGAELLIAGLAWRHGKLAAMLAAVGAALIFDDRTDCLADLRHHASSQ